MSPISSSYHVTQAHVHAQPNVYVSNNDREAAPRARRMKGQLVDVILELIEGRSTISACLPWRIGVEAQYLPGSGEAAVIMIMINKRPCLFKGQLAVP